MKPITIGVAGGTGSGKTTVALKILERVGFDLVAYVPHDAYYRDASDLPPAERAQLNFDHPDSLDNDLMITHIRQLQASLPVEIPVYDFKTHSRTAETRHIDPQPVILDCDADLRFIRRLQRDIEERERSPESVIAQYLRTVRPMHLEFVEPSKRYADVIIPEGGFNEVAVDMVAARLRLLIERE
jgi:uridine kinase